MAEAAIANVAIVDENGCFRVPSPEDILPGTTLLAALKIASSRMSVRQGPVSRKDIEKCREMMLLTSPSPCVAITHFEGKPVGCDSLAGRPAPVALWLKDALLEYMLANGTSFC